MNNPVWIDEKGKIIEPEYCRDFLSRHPMRCINDRFILWMARCRMKAN